MASVSVHGQLISPSASRRALYGGCFSASLLWPLFLWITAHGEGSNGEGPAAEPSCGFLSQQPSRFVHGDLLPPALKPFTVDSSLSPLLCWAELFLHVCVSFLSWDFCSYYFMIKRYSLSELCSGLEMGPAFFQLVFKCKTFFKNRASWA